MCLATISQITNDFDYAPDVLAVISTILTTYNAYLANINALQSPTGGVPNPYIPDADAQNQLMQLVYATCTNLYNIAQSAQTAITLTLKEDTQFILFVYSIYGPDPTDAFKLAFIANNNLDMSELFLLPSGRQITYYV